MKKLVYLLLRKARSAMSHAGYATRGLRVRFKATLNPNLCIGADCKFGGRVVLRATDGGVIRIGARCSFGESAQLIAAGGVISIGDDVHVGTGTLVVSVESVVIGEDTLIAEYVVIRDQDHKTSPRPTRSAGLLSSPLRIGRNVWIGCKASVLRGGSVGDDCVIGAHALVRTRVTNGSLAVGIPARAVRHLDLTDEHA